MRGIIATGMLLAVSLHAQNTGLFSVHGEIQAEQDQEQGRPQVIMKALVARDGTFEFRDVSTGTYEVRIVTQAGVVLRTDYTVLAPYTASLALKLPSSGTPKTSIRHYQCGGVEASREQESTPRTAIGTEVQGPAGSRCRDGAPGACH